MREYIPDGYGLSKNRMKELFAFCRQYEDWKSKGQDKKVAKIEAAALVAVTGNEVLYGCLLKNVTQGICYEHMEVPLGRVQFYRMRRKFFWLLDKEV